MFLSALEKERGVRGLGIELDPENLIAAARLNIDVIQQDIDQGLDNFPDKSFDTVVMAQALQVLHRPHRVLNDMVRIGREAIVTFPNFGHWRCRVYLGVMGRMPVSRVLPYSWYDTPNIHFCTLKDFEALCDELKIEIIARDFIAAESQGILARWLPNLFGVTAVYRIRSRTT
jgi:methionine biosynthesis protein MetW